MSLWHGGVDALSLLRLGAPELWHAWDLVDFHVHDWTETDLELTWDRGGVRPLDPEESQDLIVGHWTSAENSAASVCRNLGRRKTRDGRGLSCQLYIDYKGAAYQFCDLRTQCRHASAVNDRSVGVEMQNVATPSKMLARAKRSSSEWTILNRRRTFLDFTEAQMDTWVKLCRVICWVSNIPPVVLAEHGPDGAIRSNRNNLPRRDFAKIHGVIGHYHVHLKGWKYDPGPQPLERLLALPDFSPLLLEGA